MTQRKRQPKRGARKPNPSKPKQKAEELPAEIPEGTALGIGDLMARLGRLQLDLDSALAREQAVRAQNTEFRARLVEAGIAVEVPKPETDAAEQADDEEPLPTPSG